MTSVWYTQLASFSRGPDGQRREVFFVRSAASEAAHAS